MIGADLPTKIIYRLTCQMPKQCQMPFNMPKMHFKNADLGSRQICELRTWLFCSYLYFFKNTLFGLKEGSLYNVFGPETSQFIDLARCRSILTLKYA